MQSVTLEMGAVFKPRVQVFGFESMCRMIESGVGIGVLPESCARRYARTMRLKLVELTDTWARRRRCMIHKDLESLPLCGQALIEAIIARYNQPDPDV
ncbi:LysR substrate-binding domain-containing protein [Marinobacterium aestuariivivens]|uniref:LysR substrate-binding domain-containing protein n=1 Tax=Marinobacterium aestuariivivens TaxID=1698799 RepID=A0ABW1ZXS7_9GAMM